MMKKSFIKDYAINKCFAEFFSDVLCELKRKNKQYNYYCKKEELILNNYPRIRKVLEDKEACSLTIEEVNNLILLLDVKQRKYDIELKEIFIKGLNEKI